jgi:hypothetical protein
LEVQEEMTLEERDKRILASLKSRIYYEKNRDRIRAEARAKYKKKIKHKILRDDKVRRMILREKRDIDSGKSGRLLERKVNELIERYNIVV